MDTPPAPRTRLFLFLLALVWVVEVAWIQEYTLAPYFKTWAAWVGKHFTRLSLNFLTIALLINLLPRRALAGLMCLSFIFSLALVTYYQHFRIPLSEQVLLSQAGEATEFAGFAFSLVNPVALVLLLLALTLKLVLLKKANFSPWRSYAGKRRKKICRLLAIILPIALIWGISLNRLPRLHQLAMFNSWTIYAEAYGYLPAWSINYYWNSDPARRLEAAVSQSLPPPEVDVDFRIPAIPPIIAIIQVESLDWPMPQMVAPQNSLLPGKPVMPWLQSIIPDSLLFKVRYDYRFGTATADFEMVTGLIPGGDRIPYKVEGFPFASMNSLARIAEQKGYATSIFHGNHGFFYGRENAFKATGFDQVFFTPEMRAAGLETYKEYILDRDAFRLAVKTLAPGKNLQFIITMTSHGPWNYQPPDEDEIFIASENNEQNYFNAMRYIDNVIGEYVTALPPDSLLILFGDHMSAQKYPGHEPERVPFLVYQKGRRLAFENSQALNLAQSGELLRSDLIGVFYHYLNSLPGPETQAP